MEHLETSSKTRVNVEKVWKVYVTVVYCVYEQGHNIIWAVPEEWQWGAADVLIRSSPEAVLYVTIMSYN